MELFDRNGRTIKKFDTLYDSMGNEYILVDTHTYINLGELSGYCVKLRHTSYDGRYMDYIYTSPEDLRSFSLERFERGLRRYERQKICLTRC